MRVPIPAHCGRVRLCVQFSNTSHRQLQGHWGQFRTLISGVTLPVVSLRGDTDDIRMRCFHVQIGTRPENFATRAKTGELGTHS